MITDGFCGYLSNPSLISQSVSRNMDLRDARKSFLFSHARLNKISSWVPGNLFPRSFHQWPVFLFPTLANVVPHSSASAPLLVLGSRHIFSQETKVKEKSYISTVFQLIIFIQIMEEFTERFYCKWYIFDIFGILCHDWPRTRIIFIFYFWTISGFYLFSKYFTWHEKAFAKTKW